MTTTITVLFNNLPALTAGLEPKLQAALNESAAVMAENAQNMVDMSYPPASIPGAPPAYRTGELRNSIEAKPDAGPLESAVEVGASYAAYLEYGTRKMAARPFMTPAVEYTKPLIEAIVIKAVLP